MQVLLRVTANDFCAGAIFDDCGKGHFVCTKAAPKLEALLKMDIEKAIRRCQMMGFKTERIPIVQECNFLFDWNQFDKGTGPIRGRLVPVPNRELQALMSGEDRKG